MAEKPMSEREVLFARQGRAGVITLNRPKALNAVTLGMVRAMHPQLQAWAQDPDIDLVVIEAAGGRAFSAGGDIRVLYDWGRARDEDFLNFYREEYHLNTFIKNFPKPYVALIDGVDMGGGVGVSIHGSHRVVSENLTFAMPETGIGLFPDVGGTYFLPRCPGEIGMYLALTGARLKAADALYAGIATHHVAAENFPALKQALCDGGDIEDAITVVATEPGEAPLAEMRDSIDRHFGKDSVAGILESLDKTAGGGDGWAEKQAAIIRTKSPTSLGITHRQIREGGKCEFRACMAIEYRMVNRILDGHDFFEGIRAVVIDKDQAPKWRPPSLVAVREDDIARYFAPLADELWHGQPDD